MSENTEQVLLRVDYGALATDSGLPGAAHTRADGTPVTLPDGWNLSECVAVLLEATHERINRVETPLRRSDAVDGYEFEATVTAGTEQVADDRVRVVTRHTPDGSPTRHEGEETTEAFDLDDALDNL